MFVIAASRIQTEIQILHLPSLSSLVKSADTGNGVTFHSGDNVDLGPSHIGVSFIDAAMQMVSSKEADHQHLMFSAVSGIDDDNKQHTYMVTRSFSGFLPERCVSAVAVMSIISSQDDHFAMEVGRQPITFENPLYATAPAAAGDPAVIHATQVVNHVLFLWTLFMDVTSTCLFRDGRNNRFL